MSAPAVPSVSSRARRVALGASLLAALLLLGPAWLDAGIAGSAAAAVGALVVVVFFLASAVPLLLVGDFPIRVGAGLSLLLLTYTLRLALVLMALALLSRTDSVDRRWLAASIITCTVVWCAAHVAVVVRSPVSG